MNSHSDIEWSVERMALLRRIHELEKENARLRELLGVEIREECPKEQPIQLFFKIKWSCFEVCLRGVKMFLLADGSARRVGKQAINPFVQGSGIHSIAIKRGNNIAVYTFGRYLLCSFRVVVSAVSYVASK